MRFLFAAFVALLNGTCERPPCAPGFPLHVLPPSDPCSYTRVGWVSRPTSPCFKRWRGKCYQPPCTLDARARDGSWRLSFEWLTVRRVVAYNASTVAADGSVRVDRRERIRADQVSGSRSAASNRSDEAGNDGAALALVDWLRAEPARVPTAVLLGSGVHEAVHGLRAIDAPEYDRRMRVGLEDTAGALRPALGRSAWIILVGNGACRDAAIKYWHKKRHHHPPAAFEALVRRGNGMLRDHAADLGGAAARVAYLDRASSMETLWRVEDSPCVSHHPHGLLSDTHAQLVLNALASEEGRCGRRGGPSVGRSVPLRSRKG